MSSPTSNPFVFFTCQPGAEPALKQELAAREPGWRLAFSRPGFVSFKCDVRQPGNLVGLPLPVFARTRSVSLGRVANTNLSPAAAAVWQLNEVKRLMEVQELIAVHVWQRDSLLPGEGDFEPQVTPLAHEVRGAVLAAAGELWEPNRLTTSTAAPAGSTVIDLVLVEPAEWYVGWHRADSRIERWPGGMLPVAMPENAVSRAYLKLDEALRWSALPAERGELWVELGCAPGGASQALLDRGYRVLGVDPAEVDERVRSRREFTHLRKRAAEVRRAEFAEAKWLAADLNVAPQYTLDAVEEIVTHPATSIRGLLLTLKLASWDLAAPERVQEYVARVQAWGFRDVRLRQLVHNRRELCLAALHSRGQRRMARGRKRTKKPSPPLEPMVRFDAPREQVPRHHFR